MLLLICGILIGIIGTLAGLFSLLYFIDWTPDEFTVKRHKPRRYTVHSAPLSS